MNQSERLEAISKMSAAALSEHPQQSADTVLEWLEGKSPRLAERLDA